MNKEDVLYNIEKRFKTTMIGSIARFEESFGYLWENDSDKQQYYDDLWEYTRNSILNHGNHQIRLAIEELKSFLYKDTFKSKYQYKFNFTNHQDKNKNGE